MPDGALTDRTKQALEIAAFLRMASVGHVAIPPSIDADFVENRLLAW